MKNKYFPKHVCEFGRAICSLYANGNLFKSPNQANKDL